MNEKPLIQLSTNFAINAYSIVKQLRKVKEFILADQLLKCTTSIGANINEGQYAQSRADFISKYQIALKESGEARYWIDFLFLTELIDDQTKKAMDSFNNQLLACLTTSIKTAKSRL